MLLSPRAGQILVSESLASFERMIAFVVARLCCDHDRIVTPLWLGGVQELVPIPPLCFVRLDGVVPSRAGAMPLDVHIAHLRLCHGHAPLGTLLRRFGRHRPGRGCRVLLPGGRASRQGRRQSMCWLVGRSVLRSIRQAWTRPYSLRAAVGHTGVGSCQGAQRCGHIDLRAQRGSTKLLRTHRPTHEMSIMTWRSSGMARLRRNGAAGSIGRPTPASAQGLLEPSRWLGRENGASKRPRAGTVLVEGKRDSRRRE
jgi:hypothetical protein